ncbi:MAG: hypothetical protein ABSE80_12355, partial [Halobacteriota archaeon]
QDEVRLTAKFYSRPALEKLPRSRVYFERAEAIFSPKLSHKAPRSKGPTSIARDSTTAHEFPGPNKKLLVIQLPGEFSK